MDEYGDVGVYRQDASGGFDPVDARHVEVNHDDIGASSAVMSMGVAARWPRGLLTKLNARDRVQLVVLAHQVGQV